ncbi:uncharacterized protein [Atheta coriaria]|uniref:uncharacterized protein isoform X2 n=1 Tax=Dalotia coriaria TaxID=877792 RepID=UPI0031F3EA25
MITWQINHPQLFSEDHWSQISIRYYNQQLLVIIDDVSLISYNVSNQNEFNNYIRLFIQSYTENAVWKYHEYLYHEARRIKHQQIDSDWFQVHCNQICISLFANFEKETTLQLFDESRNLINTYDYQRDSNSQWNYKTFDSSVVANNSYILRITSTRNYDNMIAIRNVFLHEDCKIKQKQFHASILSYNGLPDDIKCTSLREKNTKLIIRYPIKNETIYLAENKKHNDFCSKFYNSAICAHRMTCNENFCYCSMGYTGKYCHEDCNWGTYGFNCESKCGECRLVHCSENTGKCPGGCKDNYIEPFCKQSDLPVLNDIASIQTDCIFNCIIIIYDNELNYDGRHQPKYYYTRLFHSNTRVTEGEITPIEQNVIHFNNLIKSAKYSYQIVLCVNAKKEKCFDKDIKTFVFATQCRELESDQINIESVNKSTTVKITSFNSETECDFSQYHWLISKVADNTIVRSGALQRLIELKFLNAFTNYTLQLTRNNTITQIISFTTDESIPNGVVNTRINSTASNTLHITWEEPFPVLGIITHYLVEWKFIEKRGCSIDKKLPDIHSMNVTNTEITLSNLHFYSTYYISISAFTKKGQGPVKAIIGHTDAEDKSNVEVFKFKSFVSKNALQVSLSVDCINWNGPVFVHLSATCRSEWCEGIMTNHSELVQYKNMNTAIQKLLPYTNYFMEIYLSSKPIKTYSKLGSVDFITLASVPNQVKYAEVYSSTENSLFLRWSAPYPPTGVLSTFLIQFKSTKWSWTPHTIKEISPCKIWTNMFCTTLVDLYENRVYVISISAVNKNVSSIGIATELSGSTFISEPQPPLNFKPIWDDSYFLHLQWQHPNKTNGPFERFEVNVDGQHINHQVPENLTYTKKTSFQCTPDNHSTAVSIQTINSKYKSILLSDRFACPVFKATFKSVPTLKHVNDYNFSIFIPTIENAELNSSLYIIILTNHSGMENACKIITGIEAVIPIQEHQTCTIIRHYDQAQYKEIEETETNVTFTEMPEYEAYELYILIVNIFEAQMSHSLYLVTNTTKTRSNENTTGTLNTTGFNIWWFMLSVIIVIVITGGLLWKYKWKSTEEINMNDINYTEIVDLGAMSTRISSSTVPPPLPTRSKKSVTQKYEKCSQKVHVSELHDYVRKTIFSDDLLAQHKIIMEISSNTIDYHRVETAHDSIEANYVSSPLCTKAYILCLAPPMEGLYHFWQMVVEECVENIVLLATVSDIKKEKLIQYWPDYQTNNPISFKDIQISLQSVEVLYNYKVYNLKVKSGTTSTKKRILHFTNCATPGRPMNPNSLTSFLQCLNAVPHSSKHPILIHDAGGYGNCANVIALVDICLRQAERDGHLDIFHQLQLLHSQRSNIMDNVEDYLLVHLILVKYLTTPQYAYPCDTFSSLLPGIDKASLTEQIEMIEDSMWQENVLRPEVYVRHYNQRDKNRDQDIIPHPSCRVFLRPLYEKEPCYINAIFVDGYQQAKQFIVTQHPLVNTVDDFWRLVIDNNVKLVISFQPEYDVEFWKKGGDFHTPNGTLIEHVEISELADFYMHNLRVKLHGTPIKKIEVNLIEITSWKLNQAVPPDLHLLMSIRLQMHRMKCEEFSSVVVMCRNGASGSGLYIAACNLLDRIESEHVVDVCTSVRNIRSNRSQFVSDPIQFHALYRLSSLFLEDFRKYSNFGTIISTGKRNKMSNHMRKLKTENM